MAVVKFGPLVSAVSGSVGGVTFSKTRTANVARLWRAPTNKRTTRQMGIRRALSRASSRWFDALTDSQRSMWESYAATCEFTNPLGESYFLTGHQMYCRHQSLYYAFGLGDLTNPPQTNGFPYDFAATFDWNHYTRELRLTTLDPGVSSSAYLLCEIHGYQKITRSHIYTVSLDLVLVSCGETLPFVIYTYDRQPPGNPGDFQAAFYYRTLDEFGRISTDFATLVPSTSA